MVQLILGRDLKDVVDLLLQVHAGAYSIEAANPRHTHEWHEWQEVKLPDSKVLIPGVISHSTPIFCLTRY